MPCGKRPLVKKWDEPKKIPVVMPSRYEQNEASVKQHWRKVMHDLELSYKDEQFWDSQCDTVRDLVGPNIFYRIAKIFNLPFEATQYQPKSETSSIVDSTMFYKSLSCVEPVIQEKFSISDYEPSIQEESAPPEEKLSVDWSVSSGIPSIGQKQKSKSNKSVNRLKSLSLSRTSKLMSKSFSKFLSKSLLKSYSSKSKSLKSDTSVPITESARTNDDLDVQCSVKPRRHYRSRRVKNPHFDLLYCNESETDMIRWNSKYKQKIFEVSASDQFSKKAEIMTKKIALEFYEWWTGLGNVEFKSEIKRPEDIEVLFQVWFDEHASRGLMLYPKVLPCVLPSIAQYVGVPEAACPEFLKRQIASDVIAETSPAHLLAFNTCLPQKMKHIPPNNNTKEQWGPVNIPEDLRTMACVWDEVQHLTSTKEFQKWLEQRPHLPMPECLRQLDQPDHDKKQLFVVPSDYVLKEGSGSSTKDLALPVSQFSIELKEVLSKLMNQE